MLVLLVFLLYEGFSSTYCKVEIKIRYGTIFGTTESSVFNGRIFYAFYGVPYAQAPIGKLRFKNPVALKKWHQPFDATTEYHGACAQGHIVHKHGIYGFEDCLHLNIYTPYLPKYGLRNTKAVIVWIHGYAFTSGFSHIHGGDFLIDNDVILVTLTHRISVFGFLKMNDTDHHTNMGLKDIVMGLKWIQNNIEAFGGDKNKVTVMGSGSAATFISLLMVKKYRKLFSKVILQSGALFSPSLFQGNPKLERKKLEKAVRESGGKDLMTASPNELLIHTAKIYSRKDIVNTQRPLIPFMPIQHIEVEQMHLKDLPIMIGFTSQESITEVLPFIHNPQYIELLRNFKYIVPFSNLCKHKYGTKKYREIGNLIRKNYFKQDISHKSMEDLLNYVSDLHKYSIYKYIQKNLNNTGGNMYVYKFNYVGNFNAAKATAVAGANKKIKGAAQGDEICYILKCDPLWEDYVKLKQDLHNRDRIFITNIAEIWANFAKYGQPTIYNQNWTWLPMTKDNDNIFLFGKHNKLINSNPEREMFKFWNDLYEKYFSPESCESKPIRDEL